MTASDLVWFVGRAGVHRLCESLVGRGYQDQQLGVSAGQVVLSKSFERRIVRDRMNDGQGKRQKRHLFAFERKKVETPHRAAVFIYKPGEQHLDPDFDKLIVAAIYQTKHQSFDAMIRSDDGDIAEDDLCRWPGKPRKNKASYERICE